MVQEPVEYRAPSGEERDQQMSIAAEAFGIDVSYQTAKYDRVGDDGRRRVIVRDGGVAAGLVAIHAGQWWGGRVVPSWPIAAVAVAPQERGSGVGFALMRETIREAHRERVAVMPLYGASSAFYRKLGFEFGGDWYSWELPREYLAAARSDATFEPFNPAADDLRRELYERRAAASAGVMARNRFFWERVTGSGDSPAHGYRVWVDGRAEGYVVVDHARVEGFTFARDVVVLTHRAAVAVLAFAGRAGTLGLRWWGGAADPLVLALPEVRKQAWKHHGPWMVRIANVEAALRGRGYPPIDATLDLDVRDDLVPENAGRWRLTLRGGEPTVERGGVGALRLEIRGLSALFTGYRTVNELRLLGLAEGDDRSGASASAVFAGPRPWLADRF